MTKSNARNVPIGLFDGLRHTSENLTEQHKVGESSVRYGLVELDGEIAVENGLPER